MIEEDLPWAAVTSALRRQADPMQAIENREIESALREIDTLIAEMGGMAEAQLADAIGAVARRDVVLAAVIARETRQIARREHAVQQQVMNVAGASDKTATDLRGCIVATKISSQLERIGGCTASLARRIEALSKSPAVPASYLIPRMGELVRAMIQNVLDAYIARDADKAADVRARDVEVDQLHSSLFRELLTYMMEDPRNITPCTHLLFVAKNIERIGDHVTNIAESVYFLVHGAEPAEKRRKGDASSLTVVATGETQ